MGTVSALVFCLGLLFNSSAMAHLEEKIYLVAIGEIEEKITQHLKTELFSIFMVNIEMLPAVELPKQTYNPKRRQYHSTSILEELSRRVKINKARERVLGIVDIDLYVEGLNFVFGEADPENDLCLISLARLRQEYYRLPFNEKLFHSRALKEAVHELGHTYGLSHCGDSRCVMYFSNSLLDTDRKDFRFCPFCQKRLMKNR